MATRGSGLIAAALLALLPAIALNAFEKVPAAARAALSGTRGKKAVQSGFVFVDGHYVKPPYRVARFGTAIFVNNEQVTDQIVSWKAFLAASNGGVAPAPAAKPAEAKAEPAPAAAPSAPAARSVDDLFDDEPAPAAAKTPAAKPKPKPVVVEEDDGSAASFAANAQTDKLLKRVNAQRAEVHRRLSAGNVCFFGSRYGQVNVPPRLAQKLMAVLPDAVRDAGDAADLHARMKKGGFAFMSKELCEDLIANRADYPALAERRRKMQSDAEFDSVVRKVRSGGL